jgi:hypothetical protein
MTRVQVVSPQSQGHQTKLQVGTNGKWKVAREIADGQGAEAGNKEAHAVLEYVVKGLSEELLTELLEGFHGQGVSMNNGPWLHCA